MKQLSKPFNLIKQSLTIFFKKENLLFFVKIYLLLLPFSIFSTFQSYFLDPNTLQPKNIGFQALITIISLLYTLVYIWILASAIEAIRRVLGGEVLSVRDTLRVGWKKYWKFLLLGLVTFLIEALGFVLLIVPGVIFLVWFSFARFIFMEETIGVKEAILKSKNLVKGRFWPVFGRLVVFGIFASIFQILVSVIPYLGSPLVVLLGALFILPSYLLYKEIIT